MILLILLHKTIVWIQIYFEIRDANTVGTVTSKGKPKASKAKKKRDFDLITQSSDEDEEVELPPAVRPWVLLAHRGDAVSLIGYRGPAVVRSAIAAVEWLRLSLPPVLRDNEEQARAVQPLSCNVRACNVWCINIGGRLHLAWSRFVSRGGLSLDAHEAQPSDHRKVEVPKERV